ncbi:phage Gp37/Gp68 family protein [Paraburkholderia phenoliruptrix]|uniref:phage Gp37/Gp68 family protein n=1 Tax=Paraburkholderia phenoliruptrix TaxID=252970 RepID=UPI001C6EB4CB|nr:phage Gp37/Gp68 family protein [Paraburkholderia phenoliruptrix]MBW9102896.1 phage Gp37/Gp68 family protein [Paraburkholderia phenoliruptrix]MBW9132869.1 phage Gp37/Gp68 family protein [Paraburkholderia ginsengiterrae]
MSENSKIEWTDHTFNPWEGCQKVGPGCDHCYAEARNSRFAGGTPINWGPGAPRRRTSAVNWRKPLQWNAGHAEFFAAHGRRQRVFCASLADVFDNAVPNAWRADLFDLIWNTPHIDWLLLTKRIGNAGPMIGRALELAGRGVNTPWPWSNVWLGATIVNQEEADRDIPKLLATPARVRFLSMEPLLGPVDLNHDWLSGEYFGHADDCGDDLCALNGDIHSCAGQLFPQPRVDWVIVGGDARPMRPSWPRALRDQCAAARVPFLFKQWGEWLPDDQNPAMTGPRDLSGAIRIGKRAAGRKLDGRTHDEFPEVA